MKALSYSALLIALYLGCCMGAAKIALQYLEHIDFPDTIRFPPLSLDFGDDLKDMIQKDVVGFGLGIILGFWREINLARGHFVSLRDDYDRLRRGTISPGALQRALVGDLPPVLRAFRQHFFHGLTYYEGRSKMEEFLDDDMMEFLEGLDGKIREYGSSLDRLTDDLADRISSLTPTIVKVIEQKANALIESRSWTLVFEAIAEQGSKDGVLSRKRGSDAEGKTNYWTVVGIVGGSTTALLGLISICYYVQIRSHRGHCVK